MLLTARKNPLIEMLLIALVILSSTCLIIIQTALAQDAKPNQNMRQLLETLNARILSDPAFGVGFRFSQPLTEDGDLFWNIPYRPVDQQMAIYRGISEIGDDFVCFDDDGGQVEGIRCTPFSNIVSVNYVDN